MVNQDVFDNLTIFFWAHLDTFGPFQTKINLLSQKDKVGFSLGAFEQKIIFRLKWSERLPTGPKGSQMVKKIQVGHFGLFWTTLDTLQYEPKTGNPSKVNCSQFCITLKIFFHIRMTMEDASVGPHGDAVTRQLTLILSLFINTCCFSVTPVKIMSGQQ